MTSDESLLTREDLVALVRSGRELASDVSLPSLLDRLLEQATRLTDSPAGSVILFDERHRRLFVEQAVGPDAALLRAKWGRTGTGIPIVGSKAGGVFSSGTPVIENDLSDDPEHFKGVDQDTTHVSHSMICVPLAVAGERIGVVQLLNRRGGPYTEHELALLGSFADIAAVALRNARIMADVLSHLGAYEAVQADPAALHALLTGPAITERLTVLFADMRGYTRFAEIVGRPEVVQTRINEFLGMLADTVTDHGGIVNKFLGDCVMALYRGTDHEKRAVISAFDIIERFELMRDRWDAQTNRPLSFLDIGVGVATDTVVLGSVGSQRVRELTAMGGAVSLAAHLMQRARDGHRVLTDRMTFRAIAGVVADHRGPERITLRKQASDAAPEYEMYEILALTGGSATTAEVTRPPDTAAAPPTEPVVFVSYSHTDAEWLEEFRIHLRPFLRREKFSVWDDKRIAAGDRWRHEIESALTVASSAVLLVSPSFLSSEFIDREELGPVLVAARRRGLRVFWIPLSSSAYDQTDIAGFQATHDPRKPLDQLTPADRNAAWVKICRKISGDVSMRPPDASQTGNQ